MEHFVLFCLVSLTIASQGALISNIVPRRDISGDIMVGGDGSVQRFGDLYYLYMQNYGDCQTVVKKGSMCVFPVNHTCGWLYNHSVTAYSSSDLVVFTPLGEVLASGALDGVLFRTKVVYNPNTEQYVMWQRVVPLKGGAGGGVPDWSGEAYAVATSDRPQGPFKVVNPNVRVRYGTGGDNALFVDDDGQAYLAYTSHATNVRVSVERLKKDYLSSSNESSGPIGESPSEAPAMFKRNGHYYLTFGPTCCYCIAGSRTDVYVATAPLGPYMKLGELAAANETHAQQNFIFETARGEWIWTGNRWASALDGVFAHAFQTWLPMFWNDSTSPPTPLGLRWQNDFDITSLLVV